MANYANLISAIQTAIKANGNEEITGPILQQALVSIINSLGSGYQFIGIATPSTTPGTPDQKVFYIGSAGTYPNFGPAVIPDGSLAVFYYDSSWHYGSVAFPLGDGAVTESKLATTLANKLFATGYKYAGIATPSTTPGTPNQSVFYIGGPGEYQNFGETHLVNEGLLGFFKYNNGWTFETVQVGETNTVKYVAQDLLESQKQQARENIGAASQAALDYLAEHIGAISETPNTLSYSSMELRVYKRDGTYVTLSGSATGRTLIYNLPSPNNGLNYKAHVSAIGSSATYDNCVAVIYWDSSNNVVGWQYPKGGTSPTGNVIRDLTIPATATKMGIYVLPYADNGCTYNEYYSIEAMLADIQGLLTDMGQVETDINAIKDKIGLATNTTISPSASESSVAVTYSDGVKRTLPWDGDTFSTVANWRTRTFNIPDGLTYTAMFGKYLIAANSNYQIYASVAYYDASNNYLGGVRAYLGSGYSTSNEFHQLTLPANTKKVILSCYSSDHILPQLYYTVGQNKTLLIAEAQTLTEEQKQQVKDNLDLNFGATYQLHYASLQLRAYKTDGTYVAMGSGSNGRTVIYNLPNVEGATNFQAYVSGIGSSSTYAGCVSVIYWNDSNNVVGYEYPQGQSANAVVELNIPEGATKVGIWVNPYSNEVFTYDVGQQPMYEPEVLELINGTKIPLSLKGKKVSVIGDSIACFGTEAQTRQQGYNAPYFIIQASDVGQQIQSYITWCDLYVNATSTTRISPTPTIGGVELTTAMIGTLQTFTPVAADVGKALGVPRWAQAYTTKPWWQVFIDAVGAELCNNASWSGSEMCEISPTSSRYSAFRMSEAYSEYTLNRVCKRDSEGNKITPDIIFICRGTNDWGASYPDPEGGGASVAESLEFPNMVNFVGVVDGANANFYEAYIWTILRLREKYPFTLICCCTILDSGRGSSKKYPPLNGSNDSISDFNEAIRKIADYMGCPLIDLAKCGITWYNAYPTYMDDSADTPTHPNTKGHKVMGQKAVADLTYIPLEKGSLTPYTVTYNLTNCKCNNMNTTVWGNCAYLGKLIPTSGSLSVTVTMGGSNVTSTVYRSADNSIRIKRITGNIVITATAS